MTRALAATLLGATLISAGATAAQSGQGTAQTPPPMQSILAGKKLVPPIKGQADVEYTKAVTKREKSLVVTKITVKNISSAPIPRLTIDETWYSKDGQMVTGGKGFINGLLQPGEVKIVQIETPYDPKMSGNQYMFSHANGSVKPHLVKAFDDPGAKKEPAAKNASAMKKK